MKRQPTLPDSQASGFTKREYFAALAMQAIVSTDKDQQTYDTTRVGQWSVQLADALIEALNEK